MDVFEKVKNVGENVVDSAKTQGEIAGMKVQKSVIEKKLQVSYAEIGKKYVDYVKNSDGSEAFDISDILEQIQPALDKLAEINGQLAERELSAKLDEENRAKQKVQDEFNSAKAKLDKALEMEIIDQEEYDEKLAIAKKKIDNYDQIRKIHMQLKMDIITKEEHDAKISALLK